MFVSMIKPITNIINKCLTCNVFYTIKPITDSISKCLTLNIFNFHQIGVWDKVLNWLGDKFCNFD